MMKILFLGQLGIPKIDGRYTRERRVEAIATRLAAEGHEVAVTCAKPFVSPNIRRFNGVELMHLPSFNPQNPGGFLNALLSLRKARAWQPDVMHVQGLLNAFLARLFKWSFPETTLIWTIDALPASRWKIIQWFITFAARAFDSISFPTRQIQYQMLTIYGVRGTYVPDGFSLLELPPLSLREWGVRKGRYVLFLGRNEREFRWLQRALKQAKSRKNVIQMPDNLSARQRETLIAGAAAILAGSDSTGNDLLTCMALGKAVIATSQAGNEELLGTTGWIVKPGDTTGLAEVLKTALKKNSLTLSLTKQAKKRAFHHFAWERIVPEYIGLYHAPVAHLVPLDSARAPRFTQLPA